VIRFEAAELHHTRTIATTMRPRDIEEIMAGWGLPPLEAMAVALEGSYFARTMFYGLEPLAMYGLAPLLTLGGAARFWIFATEAIDRHPLAFARACKRGLPELFEHCSTFTNLIDIGDGPAMRWMLWMGGHCVLQPHTRGGRLFSQFVLTNQEQLACRQA